ncbi:multicopper oxidase domain-containing protein, partial [Alkalihalophilus pseudofirmus]
GPFTGIYPWHCHILEHEDHEMMRMYEVLENQNFTPSEPFAGECSNDSFAQCFNPDKHNQHKHFKFWSKN